MKRTILLIPIFFLIISCSQDSGKTENVELFFKNGNPFCNGTHKTLSGGLFSSDRKIRIGNWNFYHPNSQLEYSIDYDETGEITNSKEFSETGNLLQTYNKKDNIIIVFDYYPNGKIKEEKIYKEIIADDEEAYSDYEIIQKEYYENGVLKSEKEYFNDKINGELIMWDSTGIEIIRLLYEDGIILTDTSQTD